MPASCGGWAVTACARSPRPGPGTGSTLNRPPHLLRFPDCGRELDSSPAGHSQLVTYNIDGSDRLLIPALNADGPGRQPIDRPEPARTFAEEREPDPDPLVPAYAQCTAPNRSHGAPLSSPSCVRPSRPRTSSRSAPRTRTAAARKASGSVEYETLTGDPSHRRGRGRRADPASASRVYDQPTLADYTGELRCAPSLPITDKLNTPPWGTRPLSATSLATHPALRGDPDPPWARLQSLTTADALVPGIVPERKRAVWELGQCSSTTAAPTVTPTRRPTTLCS